MKRRVGIVMVGLALVGCGKDKASVDPDLAMMDATPSAASSTPADVDQAAPPTETDPDDPASDEEAEPASAAEEPEPSGDPLSGYDALQLAEAAAAESISSPSYVMTPAMPTAWPPSGAEVVFFVYPLNPTDSGVSKYKCGRASIAVHLDLGTRETKIEELPTGKPLGSLTLDRGITPNDPIHAAQEALFAIASGEATAEKKRYLLTRYAPWLDAHPLLAKDLRKRSPDFIGFVTK